jgi:RNA polymerase sigma factor (sigma-70 family)
MTDGQLLERFLTEHDELAFADLVRRHGGMVLGVCRQILRDGHDAEDAFQATFLVLVRNARTIRNHDSLGSWLYGVAQRTALRAKTQARRRAHVGQGEAMAASEPEYERDNEELRPLIHEEVGRLPDKYRAPVVLCYFEGQSHEKAAEQLDWPVGTVKGRLARAREMLQSRLSRRGIALSLGLVAFLRSTEASAAVPETLVESTIKAAVRLAPSVELGATSARSRLAGKGAFTPRRLFVIGLLLTVAILMNRFARERTSSGSVIPSSEFPKAPARISADATKTENGTGAPQGGEVRDCHLTPAGDRERR